MSKHKNKRPLYGVGINDAWYVTQKTNNGTVSVCPFYAKWTDMLSRCYSASYHLRRPTYIGCSVCDDWLLFSNFRAWMDSQEWQGKELDKDILVKGNKVYSPETCVFVSQQVNDFTIEKPNKTSELPTGVSLCKNSGKFQAKCSNPFTKKRESLGYFTSKEDAHSAWKNRKHEIACAIADTQTDNRVAVALMTRYL